MKTPFTKHMFSKSGQYLFLEDKEGRWPTGTFLARFKHKGPVTMAKFKKELIANHYVEDYLKTLEHEDYSQRKAPLEILKEKNPSWYQNIKDAWMSKNS
jgi:hypothetical protein